MSLFFQLSWKGKLAPIVTEYWDASMFRKWSEPSSSTTEICHCPPPLCHPTVSTDTEVIGWMWRKPQPEDSRWSRNTTEAQRAETPMHLEEAAPMWGSKGVAIISLSSAWSQPLRPGVGVGDTIWVCAEVGTGCKLSSPVGQFGMRVKLSFACPGHQCMIAWFHSVPWWRGEGPLGWGSSVQKENAW